MPTVTLGVQPVTRNRSYVPQATLALLSRPRPMYELTWLNGLKSTTKIRTIYSMLKKTIVTLHQDIPQGDVAVTAQMPVLA